MRSMHVRLTRLDAACHDSSDNLQLDRRPGPRVPGFLHRCKSNPRTTQPDRGGIDLCQDCIDVQGREEDAHGAQDHDDVEG